MHEIFIIIVQVLLLCLPVSICVLCKGNLDWDAREPASEGEQEEASEVYHARGVAAKLRAAREEAPESINVEGPEHQEA